MNFLKCKMIGLIINNRRTSMLQGFISLDILSIILKDLKPY